MLSCAHSDVKYDILQLTSLPTTHEMVKKHQQYLKKLEQVDCLLKENGVTHVDVAQSTSDEEDIKINPGQGSGKLKNISELSCSEDCAIDAFMLNSQQPTKNLSPLDILHQVNKENVEWIS